MAAVLPVISAEVEDDQRVVIRDTTWKDFEAMLAIRGDRSGVRLYYLDGAIEIMSPARAHEDRKTTLGRLLELWAVERDVDINGFGSWTLKDPALASGAEPDECYIVGAATDRDVPDLVIEVEWSRALGLPKHEIYRRLGVRELWTLPRDGSLIIRVLEGGRWQERETSALLPALDVAWLVAFLDVKPQSQAVRALREALRG